MHGFCFLVYGFGTNYVLKLVVVRNEHLVNAGVYMLIVPVTLIGCANAIQSTASALVAAI